jgi:hypothetical protein
MFSGPVKLQCIHLTRPGLQLLREQSQSCVIHGQLNCWQQSYEQAHQNIEQHPLELLMM